MSLVILLLLCLISGNSAIRCYTCSGHASCATNVCHSQFCAMSISFISEKPVNFWAVKTCASRLPSGFEAGKCYEHKLNLPNNLIKKFVVCYCDTDFCNHEGFYEYRQEFPTIKPQFSCCTDMQCNGKCVGNSCVRLTTSEGIKHFTCVSGDNLIFGQNIMAVGTITPVYLQTRAFCYALQFHANSELMIPVEKSCLVNSNNKNNLLKDPDVEIQTLSKSRSFIHCHLSSPISSHSLAVSQLRYETCLGHFCGLLYEAQESPHRKLNTRFCLNVSDSQLIHTGCNEHSGSWTYPIFNKDNHGFLQYSRKLICFCETDFCNQNFSTIPYQILLSTRVIRTNITEIHDGTRKSSNSVTLKYSVISLAIAVIIACAHLN